MKVLISDTTNFQEPNSHAYLVLDSFHKGYESGGEGPFAGTIVTHNAIYDYAKILLEQPDIWIQSFTGGISVLPNLLQLYPKTTAFFPTGSNTIGELFPGAIPQIAVLTGAGDNSNETADNIEFFAPDPTGEQTQDYSSFSNSYIAGQIAFIASKRNCSIWQARYVAMITGSEMSLFHQQNGFGKIDIQRAVAFAGLIAPDPFIAVPPPPPPPPVLEVVGVKGITKAFSTEFGSANFNVLRALNLTPRHLHGNLEFIVDHYLSESEYPSKAPIATKRYSTDDDNALLLAVYEAITRLHTSFNGGTIERE